MPKTKKSEVVAGQTDNIATKREKTNATTSAATKIVSAKRSYTRKTVKIHVQFGGMDWNTEELTEQAIIAWAKEHGQKKTTAKNIRLYIKPEENMVYYVVNDDAGSFLLSDFEEPSV